MHNWSLDKEGMNRSWLEWVGMSGYYSKYSFWTFTLLPSQPGTYSSIVQDSSQSCHTESTVGEEWNWKLQCISASLAGKCWVLHSVSLLSVTASQIWILIQRDINTSCTLFRSSLGLIDGLDTSCYLCDCLFIRAVYCCYTENDIHVPTTFLDCLFSGAVSLRLFILVFVFVMYYSNQWVLNCGIALNYVVIFFILLMF